MNTKQTMKKFIFTILFAITSSVLFAQEELGNGLVLDKKTHDFGDILIANGPVSCTFTIQNKGSKAAVIYNVVTSCGCTDVKWTREPIRPGGKGTISITYSNDEGPYPFDKSLTVYVSDVKKPVILRVRGTSHEKKKTLEELYPTRFGSLGMKETYIKCGNLEQGGVKSDVVNVANLSDQPLKVDFANVSSNLKINITPNPIPARSTAEMEFSVYASRDKWGKNDILPGLTGWAQINGRDELPIDIKAQLDGEYIENMNFGFDIKCFFGTILSIIKSDGVVEGGTGTLKKSKKLVD